MPAQAAIVALEPMTSEVLDRLPNLRIVSKYGVGLDNVDLEGCRDRGIRVLSTPGTNSYSVAELAVSSAIQLIHRVPESSGALKSRDWQQHKGRELRGKTFGIIGCGNAGKQVALLAIALGCPVLAYDIEDYSQFYSQHGIVPVSLKTLLSGSDVISVHLPLDESTRLLVGHRALKQMKMSAILLNYSRGGIVDEAAVAERLLDGKLGGAAFDVFESEPRIDSPLLSSPRTILTCHIGGSTEEAVAAMGLAAINQLESLLSTQ
jgi:D-3-phosphoglycerate dehydrogenase